MRVPDFGTRPECACLRQDVDHLATVQVLCDGTLRKVPNLLDLGLMEHTTQVLRNAALVTHTPQSSHTALAGSLKQINDGPWKILPCSLVIGPAFRQSSRAGL